MKPTWKTYLLYASLIIIGGGLIFILFETVKAKNTGFETKTLWDWMELLIIPLVLAGGAFFLNRSEKEIERQRTEERRKEDRQLADERAELEREIAKDRQQEAALQAYLDRMSELLLKENLRTTKSEELRNVARIRTLTVLRGLDPKRNDLIIQFLREANLVIEENSILKNTNMESVNLNEVNLQNLNLQSVCLPRANLTRASFQGSNLEEANLEYANLQYADLSKANLRGANLEHANLQYADLSEANLREASLRSANLQSVDFTNANLLFADLKYADLREAIVANDQLADILSLEGARMPNGETHGLF